MLFKVFDIFILSVFAFFVLAFPVTCGVIITKTGISDGIALLLTCVIFFSEIIVGARILNIYSKYMLYGSDQ